VQSQYRRTDKYSNICIRVLGHIDPSIMASYTQEISQACNNLEVLGYFTSKGGTPEVVAEAVKVLSLEPQVKLLMERNPEELHAVVETHVTKHRKP
jgi:hypothetical protein